MTTTRRDSLASTESPRGHRRTSTLRRRQSQAKVEPGTEASRAARLLMHQLESRRPSVVMPRRVTEWKVLHAVYWLSEVIELPHYAQLLIDKAVNGRMLLRLNEELVREHLPIPDKLHEMKLLMHLRLLQEENARQQAEEKRLRDEQVLGGKGRNWGLA
jgi:hypothetical protein